MNDSRQLWDGLRGLVGRLREGRYWTERRDACLELGRVARQAAYRVQQSARDHDPDVAHWGAQTFAELQRLLTAPPQEQAGKLDEELASGGLDPDQSPAAGGTAPPDTSLASPKGLTAWLAEFTAQQGGTFAHRPGGASLTLPAGECRTQTLYLDLGHKDSTGEPLALFYSICGDARPEHLLWALQANSNLSGGAFAVIQRQERHVLIMVMRRRLAELSEGWLRQRLTYLARKADWAESRIQEQDQH